MYAVGAMKEQQKNYNYTALVIHIFSKTLIDVINFEWAEN